MKINRRKFCQCGCGKVVKQNKKFIWGHNIKNKPPWNKGLFGIYSEETLEKKRQAGRNRKGYKHSEETRKKMRDNHADFTGRKYSEETKLKMRKPKKEGTGEKISKAMMGHIVSKETRKKLRLYRGNKASNWQGGISFLPYSLDWNEELKEQIRQRDGRVCQICLTPEENLIDKYHKKLTVHHIDYNKKNCDEQNLISLCNKCHSRTSAKNDRNAWQSVFASQ